MMAQVIGVLGAIGAMPEKFLRESAKQVGISYRWWCVIVLLAIVALLVFIYFMVKG